MPDMISLNVPVTQKNFAPVVSQHPQQNDTVFELADLSKVIKTNNRSEQYRQENSDFSELGGSVRLSAFSKDPTMASASLKMLVGSEAMGVIRESGSPELLEKLSDFANEIMLSPEEVSADLQLQQESSTTFNGDFYDMLRQLASIPGATDLKTAVAQLLKTVFAAQTNATVQDSVLSQMKFISDEMSLNTTLSTALNDLAAKIAENGISSYKNDILSLLSKANDSLLITDDIKNVISSVSYNLSRIQESDSLVGDSFDALFAQLSESSGKETLKTSFMNFIAHADVADAVKQRILGVVPENAAKDITDAFAAAVREKTSGMTDLTELDAFLGSINKENGTASLMYVLSSVTPENAMDTLGRFMGLYNGDKNLNALLDRLSDVLDRIDSVEVKSKLAGALNVSLGSLARQSGVNYKPPGSMENLVDFIVKNIDDKALQAIPLFNQNTLISGMLSSPGAFTPLLHFLVPMRFEDTNAFGELWVDSRKKETDEEDGDSIHMFFDFEIEEVGDFEMELYAKNTDITVNLLCPPSMDGSAEHLKDAIIRLSAAKGYAAKNTVVGELKEKRNLLDVFPTVKDRRAGLNVSI